MDTCNWLLDAGLDPDRIQWIRPRDPWLFNRAAMQPLELVGAYMQMQARWVEAAAVAHDGDDFARRLESDGVFVRIDTATEAEVFRGATISTREIDALATVERVVRAGKVLDISPGRITLHDGHVAADPDDLYVDCTAEGVRPTVPRPVFEPGRITIQYVTIGIVPWTAATIGAVEALRDDDTDKNRLCPPLTFTGNVADTLAMTHAGMTGLIARSGERDIAAWNAGCRLDPARAAAQHADDPDVASAFAAMADNIGPAMRNLSERTVGVAAP
jgi:hypothetical protein